MTSPACEEDLLFSLASLSPPLSLKSGTLELLRNSNLFILEIFLTPEPTLPDIQISSTTNTQNISSTLKTRHSPSPLPTSLQVTIENITYTLPSKRIYS